MKTEIDFNLLPCPFCGSQPEWINEAVADSHFYIRCPHCHIVMKEDRRDKVIGMWNRRVRRKRKRKNHLLKRPKTIYSQYDVKAPGFNQQES